MRNNLYLHLKKMMNISSFILRHENNIFFAYNRVNTFPELYGIVPQMSVLHLAQAA